MTKHYLGFDIGGTKCAVVLGRLTDTGIEFLGRRAFPTETEKGPTCTLDRLETEARSLLSGNGINLGDTEAVGISCGGPLDGRKGLILSPPNLPGWDEVPIVDHFASRFGIPVRLRNDADACALAEWHWGAGKGVDDMIFLTFGTGMGAGLILGGRLYTGAGNLAGEVGHIRLAEDGPYGYGKNGSFEGFCSGGGIADLARRTAQDRWAKGETVSYAAGPEDLPLVTAQKVAEAAARGDEAAKHVYAVSARYLGRGLSILIDILNPGLIVVGSIFARQHELLWPEAGRVIAGEALSLSAGACRVVPAALGERIGDYGCMAVALGIG